MSTAIYKPLSVLGRLLLAATVVTLLWGAMAAPAQAQNQSTAEMQAMIQSLFEQIATLQAQLPANDVGEYNGIDPDTFTRSLYLGDRGQDVLALQQFLNQDARTQVASSGAGSPGNETIFFGPATADAVQRFQELYRTEILEPVGLTAGTGFFGLSTREHVRHLLRTSEPEPEPDDTFSVTVVDGLMVEASFTAMNGCPSYGIDWGDGTETARTPQAGMPCTQALQQVVEEHTYDEAGVYTVTLQYRDTQYEETVRVRETDEDVASNVDLDVVSTDGRKVTVEIDIDREDQGNSVCGPVIVGSIAWGDSTTETVTQLGCSSQGSTEMTHEYDDDGRYTIAVEAWDGDTDEQRVTMSDTNSEEYELADVRSVVTEDVDPIPDAIDDEYTRYTITLENGTVHNVRRYGMAPYTAFVSDIRDTGYVGDIDDLLDMVKSDTAHTGTYRGYMNGQRFIVTRDITQADARENCKENMANNPQAEIYCTWNGDTILDNREEETETATYRGYFGDGHNFITTEDITRAEALENCEQNAENNPHREVYCTWGEETIFDNRTNDTNVSFMFGVYEGGYPDGDRHSGGYHPQGEVDIYLPEFSDSNPDRSVVLVLTAYEPVQWNISGPGRRIVQEVVASGYYNQEVVGFDSNIPVHTSSYESGDREYYYTYREGTRRYDRLVDFIEAEYGEMDIIHFYGDYTEDNFDLTGKG